MKGIMFWTLVLVIPSFVFFYGWQSSSKRRGGRTGLEREGLVLFKDRWFGLRERSSDPRTEELARRELEQDYLYTFRSQGLKVSAEEIRSLVGPREIAGEVRNAYYLDRLVRRWGLRVTENEVLGIVEELLRGRPVDELRKEIRQQGMSEQEFLEDLAYRQAMNKAKNLIFSRAKASLFELWQEYLIGQEKIQIRYVAIPTQDFEKQVQPTTESLQAFYQKHSDDYRVGDRAEFRYVAVFRSDCEKEIAPTTDSIVAFYEKNKEKLFSRRRSANVRHIFLRAPSDAPASDVLKAETSIRGIAAKIKAGANFAEMADTFSEDTDNVDPKDPTKKRGGLIPMPVREDTRSVFGDEFKRAALSLAADEVSSPVRASQGFHLIKADKVTTAGILAFDEVKDQARQTLRDELVDAEFKKRGEAFKTAFTAKSYSTLDSFAEATSIPIGQTDLIDLSQESGFLPRIGPISENLDLIKTMGVGELMEAVLKSSEAYYVLELKRKEPSHVPPFEEVIKDVQEDYVTSAAANLAHQAALDMVRQSKTLEDLQKLAEKQGLQLKQSALFTRQEAGSVLPNLDPRFRTLTLRSKVGTIHLVTQGDPKRPVAYVVWYFEKNEKPSIEQFRKDLPTIRAEYLLQTQEALVEEWLHDMARQIPARINPIYESKEKEEPEKNE
jgi:peptidyl-prolyl cis-trans isomerase D